MGFSGCKIHGHSGTANKPRKPFFKSKRYQAAKTTRPVSQQSNITVSNYTSHDLRIANRTNSIVKYAVKVPLLIGSVLLILFVSNYYLNLVKIDLDIYQADLTNEANALTQSQNVEAYQVLVKDGFRYLKLSKYSEAQYEFTMALRVYENGERARIGLYTALSQQCVLHGRYCDEAEENLVYLRKAGYVGR